MRLPVILRPLARQDLRDARTWYDRQRSGLGHTFARRVSAAIDRIGQTPELYGIVDADVRAAPVHKHPHLVYYRVFADRVEVLAVVDGRRDPAVLQGRI